MKFIELAKLRYSSRAYDRSKNVEKEKIIAVIEAARVAPSANNFQPWKFVVIQDEQNLAAIHETYHRTWFKTAPVVIVAIGDHSQAWVRKEDGKIHTDIDLGIAVDHLTLQAAELGLATCWVCHFDTKKVKQLLNLTEQEEPIALIPLGYPTDKVDIERHSYKRKKLDEILFWEKIRRL